MLSPTSYPVHCTVLTLNSCTKCVGSPGMIPDRTPDCHPVLWVWKRRWPHSWTWIWFIFVDVLGLLLGHSIHWCVYNQALADVRSTGAGIECPYCTCRPGSGLMTPAPALRNSPFLEEIALESWSLDSLKSRGLIQGHFGESIKSLACYRIIARARPREMHLACFYKWCSETNRESRNHVFFAFCLIPMSNMNKWMFFWFCRNASRLFLLMV